MQLISLYRTINKYYSVRSAHCNFQHRWFQACERLQSDMYYLSQYRDSDY